MHGKMDPRGAQTMMVKQMNRKSRKMEKTINSPAGDGNSKSKILRKSFIRSKQTEENEFGEGLKSSKLPTRRNLDQAAGRKKTKSETPFETHETHRPQALSETKKGFNTNKPKRQRRSTANPVAPIAKKTVRRARQTIRKRTAATRKKTAAGKQTRIC